MAFFLAPLSESESEFKLASDSALETELALDTESSDDCVPDGIVRVGVVGVARRAFHEIIRLALEPVAFFVALLLPSSESELESGPESASESELSAARLAACSCW